MSRMVRVILVYVTIVVLAGVGANLAAARDTKPTALRHGAHDPIVDGLAAHEGHHAAADGPGAAPATDAPAAADPGAGASPATPTLDPRLAGYPELTLTITDEAIVGPREVPAGPTLLTQVNETAGDARFVLFRIPDDVTDGEYASAMASQETPDWFRTATLPGNPDRAAPNGGRATALVHLLPGRYDVADPTHPRSSHRLVVTGEAAPMPEVEGDVRAEMLEMAVTMPAELQAGPLVWEVVNTGAALHEIALIPVPEGATAEDVAAAFTLQLEGTPISPELGEGWAAWDGLPVAGIGVTSPGGRVFAQIDLAPGTYVAVRFFPDLATFQPQLTLAMLPIFTVS